LNLGLPYNKKHIGYQRRFSSVPKLVHLRPNSVNSPAHQKNISKLFTFDFLYLDAEHCSINNASNMIFLLTILKAVWRIRCLFDPWIRDPGWVKKQDQDPGSKIQVENPGSYFREFRNNFLTLDPG
jgi:hypothetical protein